MMIPLILLALGSIFVGVFFKDLFIGHDSDLIFWKNSIFFIAEISKDHPPFWFLILTPSLVLISIPISPYISISNDNSAISRCISKKLSEK